MGMKVNNTRGMKVNNTRVNMKVNNTGDGYDK